MISSIDILPTFCLLVWNNFSSEHSFDKIETKVHNTFLRNCSWWLLPKTYLTERCLADNFKKCLNFVLLGCFDKIEVHLNNSEKYNFSSDVLRKC